MLTATKVKVAKLPTGAGVYLFKKRGSVLYIGKANNLRSRLRTYFGAGVPTKVQELLEEATKLEVQKTESEPEALILEAQLIKKHQPKYNVIFRDDKNYFFVGLTQEKYSRIFLTHQPFDFAERRRRALSLSKGYRSAPLRASPKTNFIGPFTEGRALKMIIKSLRKTIPFCICRSKHDKLCLNYYLGLCAGVCCLKLKALEGRYQYLDTQKIKERYARNIRYVKGILKGQRKRLAQALKKEMYAAARKEDFERAAYLRDVMKGLENILAHRQVSFRNEFIEKTQLLLQLKKSFKLSGEPNRIEAYDISNIAGTLAVGTMVVFTKTELDQNEYRKFKIKTVKGANDVAMMKEMLRRRFAHQEWKKPDLIYMDGGIAQLNAAREVIAQQNLPIPIIAFAKGLQNVFASTLKKPIPLKNLPQRVKNFIVKLKDEVHRFSITYHRQLRSRALLQ